MKFRYRLFLLVFAAMFVGPHVRGEPGYQPEPGQVHPDFVFPRIDTGEPFALSNFRGKKVLLIHFASW